MARRFAPRPSELSVVLKGACVRAGSKNRQNIERGAYRRGPRNFQDRLSIGQEDIVGCSVSDSEPAANVDVYWIARSPPSREHVSRAMTN
jgi:hypothetical protein